MKIFNFVLESKLDLHSYVKFDGKCDEGGRESLKPYLALIDPAPIDIRIKEIARQKDTDNHVSFLAEALKARFAFCDLYHVIYNFLEIDW